MINIMAPDASISLDHGWPAEDAADADAFLEGTLVGLSREEARKRIVQWFKDHDLLEEVKPYRHAVGHSYRSHVPVEPYLSDQWYVKVTDDRLAGAALRAMAPEQRSESEGCAWTDEHPFSRDAQRSASVPTGKANSASPPRYAKTFQTWHENIRDWCITRQLWWGHRIPVWHFPPNMPLNDDDFPVVYQDAEGFQTELRNRLDRFAHTIDIPNAFYARCECKPTGECDLVICTRSEEADRWLDWLKCEISAPFNGRLRPANIDEAVVNAAKHLGEMIEPNPGLITQDPDVLDTWFSSALWPIGTMGWPNPAAFPEEIPEGRKVLDTWNPTNTLCTAREIITLWVSRMVMFNPYFRNCLPFRDVFIHAMIQDGARPEDVQESGQRRRSDGHHPQSRLRRHALHARGHDHPHAGRAHARGHDLPAHRRDVHA